MADYIEREVVKGLLNINYGGYLDAVDRIPAADVARWCMGGGLRGRRQVTTYLRHTDMNARSATTLRRCL